jgi:ssDNA-binding Zn-finger/Zn-ribbon topoisomerase 1
MNRPVYCDECLESDMESEMVLREGAYGDFYGCKRYPECNYSLNERQYRLAEAEQADH